MRYSSEKKIMFKIFTDPLVKSYKIVPFEIDVDPILEEKQDIINDFEDTPAYVYDSQKCYLCFDEKATILFPKCGHIALCDDCAIFRKKRNCPLCKRYSVSLKRIVKRSKIKVFDKLPTYEAIGKINKCLQNKLLLELHSGYRVDKLYASFREEKITISRSFKPAFVFSKAIKGIMAGIYFCFSRLKEAMGENNHMEIHRRETSWMTIDENNDNFIEQLKEYYTFCYAYGYYINFIDTPEIYFGRHKRCCFNWKEGKLGPHMEESCLEDYKFFNYFKYLNYFKFCQIKR